MASNVEDIETAYDSVKTLYEKGDIPANSYYKCLVALAFEYAVEGKINEASNLLEECPVSYFEAVLPSQMAVDKLYCKVAYDLATILRDSGAVVQDSFMLTTTKISQA